MLPFDRRVCVRNLEACSARAKGPGPIHSTFRGSPGQVGPGERGSGGSGGVDATRLCGRAARATSRSSAIIGVLDGSCHLAARLRFSRPGLGGGRVLRGLEPVADADGDRSGGLDGVRGEDRAAGAGGDARERGEGADGDEHGREGGHHFGVLGREEVERVAGVQQPERRVRHLRGDCDGGVWGVRRMWIGHG